MYNVSVLKYEYHISFLRNSKIEDICGDNIIACQKGKNPGEGISIGSKSYELSYFDGKITQILKKGKLCRDGFRRSSIIDFTCDKSADEAKVEFEGEKQRCLYFFKVKTKHACINDVKKTEFPACSVTHNDTTFDLSPLKETDWRVIPEKNNVSESVYVSVCSYLSSSSSDDEDKYAKCLPDKTSVCLKKPDLEGISYGSFKNSPVYMMNGTIKLVSTKAKFSDHITEIKFLCDLNDVTGPTYNIVGKTMKINWPTRYACPQKPSTGEECQINVYGSLLNFVPLTKIVYRVNVSSTEYYEFKICESFPKLNTAARHCVGKR